MVAYALRVTTTQKQLPATRTLPKSIRQQRVFNRNHRLATTTGDLEHSRGIRSVTLARVPTRWNHLVEKNSRKFNDLSMILSQKWFPLLRIML